MSFRRLGYVIDVGVSRTPAGKRFAVVRVLRVRLNAAVDVLIDAPDAGGGVALVVGARRMAEDVVDLVAELAARRSRRRSSPGWYWFRGDSEPRRSRPA